MINNAHLTRLLEKISNVHNKSELDIVCNAFDDIELESIGQALENRRGDIEISLTLKEIEREQGVTALMTSLKKNRHIKNITLATDYPLPTKTLTVFMNFLKDNHNLVHFGFFYWKKVPPKDFIDDLYNILEQHASIKSVCFEGLSHIERYINRFFGLKNITSIELQSCNYLDSNAFFGNLNFPEHLETFKQIYCHFAFDANYLLSFLEAIKKSNIRKFDFGMTYGEALPKLVESKESFVEMLMKKESLTSLALGNGDERSFCERPFKSIFNIMAPKQSNIEELFALLKNSKTLKELSISHTPFMKKSYNVTTLCKALNVNKRLIALQFNNIQIYHNNSSDKVINNFIEAIFSNPNLKSLTLSRDKLREENLKKLVEKLVSGHGLTELNLSDCHYGKEDAKLFAQLLEKNTTLESLDLSGSKFDSTSAELFLTSIRKNRNSNLTHLDILYQPYIWQDNVANIQLRISDKVMQDIHAELEKNVKKKRDKIRNALLAGTKCQDSPLKALHGKNGPLGLICDFLFEKERPIIEPSRALVTKEQKEKEESQTRIEEPTNVSCSVEIKKLREEFSKQNTTDVVNHAEASQSNAAPISPAYLQSLSQEVLSEIPSVFFLLASYNHKVDIHP